MSDSHDSFPFSAATLLAQAHGAIDPATDAVVPPIHVATTYLRGADNSYPSGRVYSRADNPTYLPAEQVLKALEQGEDALLFASGMAAVCTVFQALAPGDRVIAPTVMYWALRNWLQQFAAQWGLELTFVDTSDVNQVKAALAQGPTRLVWLETPGNPLWTVSDIAKISQLAKQHGALVAVDSTCATPLLTQPLKLGADIVMHSATKYLNGHSDVISGALVTAKNDAFWQQIRTLRGQLGAVPSPHDAAQLLRGMRTMHLRVREACNNALYIADRLQQHRAVKHVLYPGLPNDSGHAVAKKQMHGGFGGMLSVRFRGGAKVAIHVAANTKLWKRATSLGGVESLIEHRASIEGEGTPCPDDLLRLSCGIEQRDELLADLLQALESAPT